MKWQSWLLVGLTLTSFSSNAVTRVGGGTLFSDEMMFSSPVPNLFKPTVITEAGDVRMEGPRAMSTGDGGFPAERQTIQIFMLPNERPDLANLTDRLQVRAIFSNQGWIRLHHTIECVDWYEKQSGHTLTQTLVWGHGRGVILAGRVTDDDVAAINDLAVHLALEQGSCGWK